MATLQPTRASQTFLQRAGIMPTVVGPLPTKVPGDLIVHRFPLAPPLPRPGLLLKAEGTPPPDREAPHGVWPHGPDPAAPPA